jgi:hypothetical protein
VDAADPEAERIRRFAANAMAARAREEEGQRLTARWNKYGWSVHEKGFGASKKYFELDKKFGDVRFVVEMRKFEEVRESMGEGRGILGVGGGNGEEGAGGMSEEW